MKNRVGSQDEVLGGRGVSNTTTLMVGYNGGKYGKKPEVCLGGMGRLRTYAEVVSKGGLDETPGVKLDEEGNKDVKEARWDGVKDKGWWLSKCATKRWENKNGRQLSGTVIGQPPQLVHDDVNQDLEGDIRTSLMTNHTTNHRSIEGSSDVAKSDVQSLGKSDRCVRFKKGGKGSQASQDVSLMDHGNGLGSLQLAIVPEGELVPEVEPKEVGFHIDLCSGPVSNLKAKSNRRKRSMKTGAFRKDAKNIQLMMKRGMLLASLVHKRHDHHRNLNDNRMVNLRRKELEDVNSSDHVFEDGVVNLPDMEYVGRSIQQFEDGVVSLPDMANRQSQGFFKGNFMDNFSNTEGVDDSMPIDLSRPVAVDADGNLEVWNLEDEISMVIETVLL
ncbi:hypothetical protein Q3G72_016357 [Acer saccharum]|nr:hypothetical protein Q3G72_016357 [Acer saccharum]